MKLGMQLYGPIARGTLTFEELARGLRDIGIARLEPCITLDGESGAPTFWKMEECENFINEANKNGLEIISCHCSSKNYLDTMDAMYVLADKFGIKQFVMGTGELNKDAIIETSKVYREMAELLKPHGACLLLHNGKPDIAFEVDGKTAYEYLVDICDGAITMQFDTGWAARGGKDPLTLIERNKERITSLHFKDFDMTKDTDVDTCIGDGTLDNKSFLEFGLKAGIPLFIDADTYDDVLEDSAKSFNYLNSLFEK